MEFRNGIIAGIESSSEHDPVTNSSEKSLGLGEDSTVQDTAQLEKRVKSASLDVQNETLNELADSVPNGLIKAMKNKEKSTKYPVKT